MGDITASATARAHANIAFVKYWGNRDQSLRLPANGSISMNLAQLHTTTTVEIHSDLVADTLTINQEQADESAQLRVRKHLDALRARLGFSRFARVDSINNFPMGTGIASSAAAFAALTTAVCAALDAAISERELSALARLGSGSAARSIPSGFVEWHNGGSHDTSYAESFARADHWKLIDLIAIVSREHKRIGSSAGHETAPSSPFQAVRVASAAERIASVKSSILRRDFEQFAEAVEEDSNLMHAVMMTSKPALIYWEPLSLAIMDGVRRWRQTDDLMVCYTLDAGPNVHCICAERDADAVAHRLRALSGDMEILRSGIGGGAYVLPAE
jgi:diphosphomevalonate decarboxylase